MTPGQSILFKMVEAAVIAGARAPTNEAICEHIGWSSKSEASEVLAQLEKIGAVSVERFNSGRVVTILAGPHAGQSTADLPESLCKKPWRARAKRPRLATVSQRIEAQAGDDAPRGAFALARPVLAHAPASAMKGRELLIGGEIWALIESEAEITGRPLGVVFDAMLRDGADALLRARAARPSAEKSR